MKSEWNNSPVEAESQDDLAPYDAPYLGAPDSSQTREGLVRLLALLSLLGASAAIYVLAGAAAMPVVAGGATALFAAWQHRSGGGR